MDENVQKIDLSVVSCMSAVMDWTGQSDGVSSSSDNWNTRVLSVNVFTMRVRMNEDVSSDYLALLRSL